METATSAGRERPVLDAEAALRFLAEASSVLGGSLNYEDTVQRVANLLVPRIGTGPASTCSSRTGRHGS